MATLGTHDDAEDNSVGEKNSLVDSPVVAKPLGWLGSVKSFWHELGLEMKKVSWPARTEVVNTTVIVIVAVFFFAAYLFATDLVFTYVIQGLEWGARKIFG